MRRRLTLDHALPLLRDDDACLSIFFRWRWPRGFTCPHCTGRSATRVGGRRAWRCTSCRRQIHVTAGTIMHGSHIPLRLWLYAIAMVGGRKQSISATQLGKDTGLAYSSAWSLLHRIRRALHDNDLCKLRRGVVEVTTAHLTPGDARTHPVPSWWSGAPQLAIAIERNDPSGGRLVEQLRFGRLRASVLPIGTSLAPFVRWASHQPNPEIFPHTIGLTVMKNLIAWLRGTFHGVSVKYLQAYLDEAMFRFDRRRREDLLPIFVGRRVMTADRATRRDLATPPRPVEAEEIAATEASAAPPTHPTASEYALLAPASRELMTRLLAMPVSGAHDIIFVDDLELVLAVKQQRPDLPIRLRRRDP